MPGISVGSAIVSEIQASIERATSLREKNPQEALDIVGRVRARLSGAPQADAAPLLALCALNAAWSNVRMGQFGASCSEAEEGLRLFKKLGDNRGAAGCLLVLGIAKAGEGLNQEAVQMCRESEELFLKAGDPTGRARAINASGGAFRRMGDPERAIEAYNASLLIAQENGDHLGESRALTNIGYTYLYEKKFEQAVDYARRVILREEKNDDLAGHLANCSNLIQALVGAGRPQEAIDFIADYDLKKLSESGLLAFLELSDSLAKAYMTVGRFAEAADLLDSAIQRARRNRNLGSLGYLLCTFARLQRTAPVRDEAARKGALGAAKAALDEALALANSKDWDSTYVIHEEYCQLLRELGLWNEAFLHLAEAHRIAMALNTASADQRLARQRSEQEAAIQRERAEAEARQLQIERKVLQSQKIESLGVLAGGVAHHFNNLLTSILGYSELAELNPSMTAEALSEIKVAGQRAAELCRQIMMYTGRSEARFATLALGGLIRESVGLLRVTLVSGCEVECELPERDLSVWGDPAQIQQIVVNLVTNSAEAKATRVLLRASATRIEPGSGGPGHALAPGDYVEFCVIDNGEGMTPDVLARVFEPFFSTRFAGRGLGLPAVMGLVRAHKGAITAESSPGAGCTIRILLPVAVNQASAQPRPAAEPLPKRPSVVLIADDEEPVKRVISKFMTRLGWKTLDASDGEEAVRKYSDQAGKVDLLLIDHLMPKLNGLDAARRIRSLNPRLPVIMMSGFTNGETLERFRTEGFDHFLKKPFELKELRDLLQQVSEPPGPAAP